MSTTTLDENAATPVISRVKRPVPAWAREPLLHFVALGVLLFGIDHVLATRAGDPHTIVIDAEVDAQAIKVFKEARGHNPNSEQLYALRKVWLDNEVLYREGIALGLDKGDPAIRERVIFKALSMVDANTRLPAFDEALLRQWFEAHRKKYDEPARFDFEEAVIAGDRSESAARAFTTALNAGTPGDTEAGLRVFTARPQDNIVQSYGAEFAAALAAAPEGEWQALPSREGVRVIRLKAKTPASAAKFEDLGSVVLQDWTDAVMSEQRSEAVHALARKYKVKVSSEK
ncbi:MAG TPA: peptidylprolyl isomerase [Steroidobacteraceae bacterium]|nr:peptidylprolyl isomerase [Steroidobacteraceae bacterium]